MASAVTINIRSPAQPFYPLFVAIVVSQICLIAIWVCLSQRSWPQKAVIAFIATAVFTGELLFEEWHNPVGFHPLVPQQPVFVLIVPIVLVLSIVAFIVGTLTVFRRQIRLYRFDKPPPTLETLHLQFTIRKTMCFTAFVGVLLAMWQMIETSEFYTFGSTLGSMVMILFVSFWFAIVSLTSVWAAFGAERPSIRFALVFSFSMIAGMIPPAFFQSLFWEQAAWIVMMPFVAIVVFASLLVVRKNGYRLKSALRS
ncbi:MAG: hypothetical protein OES79_10445 [Planctomycetota bacterium]|nr:hypothetical protein [Planctomycetota bacterium]